MTLSASDVRSIQFRKPPLGKRGYDEEQVDSFLDEVERTITELTDRIAALQAGRAPAGPTRSDDLGTAMMADLDQIKTRLARIEASLAGRPSAGSDPLFGR